jgi:beta-phosphoglucomutase
VSHSAPLVAPGLALIFDMDGVIVDSNPLHRETWEEFNRRHGLETTEEMHAFMYGKRNDDIVRHFYGAALPEPEVHARGAAKEALYREIARTRLDKMLLPGLRDFLDAHRGYPIAIASNAEPENIELILDGADLRRYFRVVVDGHQVVNPKPHPEIYLRVADLLGVQPANSVVFEDSHTGVEAARAAGMRVVGICTTHDDLPGTSISVDNFESRELRQWLASERPLER